MVHEKHKELIDKWLTNLLSTDELENELEKLNKEYGTCYKITWRKING